MVMRNLEFEIRWQLGELIRKYGLIAVLGTAIGQKLLQNLEALKAARQVAA